MHIELKTDNHISVGDDLSRLVESEVENALRRFGDHVVRVLVHVSDSNAHKGGGRDKRCMMEARIAGHQPVAVTHEAATLEAAIGSTAEKLERSLDHILGKLGDKKGRTSFGGAQIV